MEGLVWFEQPLTTGGTRYAVLVGANSYTQDLGTCLLSVSLQVSKVIAQAAFCSNLLTKAKYHETPVKWKLAFVCIFVAGVLLWVGSSLWATRSKLKAEEITGDSVKKASRLIRIKFMFSSLLFQMFNVPDKITEAPIRFHPRKAVQPYASLKLQKHRFWILGWPTKEQYEYENGAGLISQLPMTILLQLPLVVLQVHIMQISLMSGITLALTSLSLIYQLLSLQRILKYRKSFKTELQESVQGGWASFANKDDAEKETMLVKYKLLRKHFHEEPPKEVKEKYKELFLK